MQGESPCADTEETAVKLYSGPSTGQRHNDIGTNGVYLNRSKVGKMNEIFVAIKETDYIEAQIGELCEKYNNRCGADYVQQRALFRVVG